MQIFVNLILVVACVVLLGMCWVQAEYVSWAHDKCGAIGVLGVTCSSAYVLLMLYQGVHIHYSAALLVAGFAVWLVCRKINYAQYPHGPLGASDRAPLGAE